MPHDGIWITHPLTGERRQLPRMTDEERAAMQPLTTRQAQELFREEQASSDTSRKEEIRALLKRKGGWVIRQGRDGKDHLFKEY